MRSRLGNDEAQVCFIGHAPHGTRSVRAPIRPRDPYAAECVEGKFSKVRQEFTASSSPRAMVLAGWVLLPSSSFSFPGLLVGFPRTHPSLFLPLFTGVR